jgi:hypothetical protein
MNLIHQQIVMPKKLILFCAILIASGCTQNPKHPQADLLNKTTPSPLTPVEITQFADSVYANKRQLELLPSLIYSNQETFLNVQRYSENGTPKLYIRHFKRVEQNTTEKFFLNNDTLVLIVTVKETKNHDKQMYTEEKIYLRNNVPFKSEVRNSSSLDELNHLAFKDTSINKSNLSYREVLNEIDDAAKGINNYLMVFDQIIDTGDEVTILLKDTGPYKYSASITANIKDSFIDSLSSAPHLFKDQILKLNWKIVNGEAVYVPKLSKSSTSASGLNK